MLHLSEWSSCCEQEQRVGLVACHARRSTATHLNSLLHEMYALNTTARDTQSSSSRCHETHIYLRVNTTARDTRYWIEGWRSIVDFRAPEPIETLRTPVSAHSTSHHTTTLPPHPLAVATFESIISPLPQRSLLQLDGLIVPRGSKLAASAHSRTARVAERY